MILENLSEYKRLPFIPLRGLVAFPEMTMHFDVGRKFSVNALKNAMEHNREVFLIAQKNMSDEDIIDDIYDIGCVATVSQMLKMPDGTVRVVVECEYRAGYLKQTVSFDDDCYYADVIECQKTIVDYDEVYVETVLRRAKHEFLLYAAKLPKIAPDIPATVEDCLEAGYLADYITFNLRTPYYEKQKILETGDPVKRLESVIELIKKESEILDLDNKLSEKVRDQIDDNQREYYLREQIKAINSELYGDENGDDESQELVAKIESLCASDTVKERLLKEVGKYMKTPQGSQEGAVIRSYIDTLIELPWDCYTDSRVSIKKAEKILERDFYGMDKVKQRILEMLSVYILAPDIKGQIICLVGPPGVGKTSICKTIAECMGRRFARVSLGGVRDEAEIRGHRRTYVGSMPGKIINAVKQSGSGNPLILLDEIDKLGNDYKGDPSSALLEVLDPEQNATFTDHYVDMPYDLSHVVFITTANSADTIPAPLLDRMEVIELSSYTREEKFNIAKKHLVTKEVARHGLTRSQVKITDKAIYSLIDFYTRESGVRRLEREIAALCRKSARKIAESEQTRVTVDEKTVIEMLGKHRYLPEQILPSDEVGVVNGLAWTAVGGEIMQLEVAVCEGTGKLELTGSLGEVMQESAKAAVTFVRCHARELGIDPGFYKKNDIHIHATEAAVPKDGPSAGVTITTALVSALTGEPIRRDVAMTGEVTVRGRVLPIGGLKEKSMAALRGGVKTVFIPDANVPDLAELDSEVIKGIKFIPVKTVDQVIESAIIHKNVVIDSGYHTLIQEKEKNRKTAVISQ